MSEETIKGSDGNVYDVTDVTDDKTDIVIIKRNGKIVEQQITQKDKVRILYNINQRRCHDLTTIQISPKRVHRFTQKHHKTPKNT